MDQSKIIRKYHDDECLKVFKQDVLSRFRVPQAIVTNHGTQFTDMKLKILSEELNVK